MNNFVTSDMHFGHENILKYCNRPFKDVNDMNNQMIKNWNERIKPDDSVYHLGDWCFHGGIEGGKSKSSYWEEQLNGKIIHIKGNHDYNNGVKPLINIAVCRFAQKELLMQHRPPSHEAEIPDFIDYVLCGHVHEKWKHQIMKVKGNNIVICNVGIDQWDFYPMKLIEIIEYCNKVKKDIDEKDILQTA